MTRRCGLTRLLPGARDSADYSQECNNTRCHAAIMAQEILTMKEIGQTGGGGLETRTEARNVVV
jgi:hypothetical protein